MTSDGDVTYNPRRGILGAIPVWGKTAYHLYSFSSDKAGNIVKPIRKSRWLFEFSSEWGIATDFLSSNTHSTDDITSFDFNPNGEMAATITGDGACLVSDMDTDKCSFQMKMEMPIGNSGPGKQNFSISQILLRSSSFVPLPFYSSLFS